MSDDKRTIEAPMAVFVKGGTLTSAYEKQLQKEDWEAEERRKLQDAQALAARTGKLPQQLATNELRADAPGVGKLSSMRLGGSKSHASVVLGLKHPKDTTIQDWIICELSQQPGADGKPELVLIVACPRCIKTLHRHPQRAQMTIRESNRKFWLDTRRQGEIFANPEDPNEVVTLAGTITTEGWITCPQLGCGWKFKIDDSIVHSQ